jgi:hypothetical protein
MTFRLRRCGSIAATGDSEEGAVTGLIVGFRVATGLDTGTLVTGLVVGCTTTTGLGTGELVVLNVGFAIGEGVGGTVGTVDGETGVFEGLRVGFLVVGDWEVGRDVVRTVGGLVGLVVGNDVGRIVVGNEVGRNEGLRVGVEVGDFDGGGVGGTDWGVSDGRRVGVFVGRLTGACVGLIN